LSSFLPGKENNNAMQEQQQIIYNQNKKIEEQNEQLLNVKTELVELKKIVEKLLTNKN
jgi:uncharacterized protein involved in tolerance to divalent cations